MNPTRFQSRSDLCLYAAKHVPLRSCARAINEGRVELLGGFSSIPPLSDPGFLLKVTSRHGREWIIAISIDEIKHRYKVWIAGPEIPWWYWMGCVDGPRRPAYDGDHPMKYAEKQKEAFDAAR